MIMAATLGAGAQMARGLREVVVTARRPVKEIGVQKTTFDSLALKENAASSMADVLAFNSSVFVKSYGRATLSTVAFRGTSPSHTQVTWNGVRINNPMLGMTDFSTIPSFFIDGASLLHGTSSVNEAGGGLGGLVKLSTSPDAGLGLGVQYVQGVGSFKTFDEFARLTYGNGNWRFSTRMVHSKSANDYTYTNHDKKENIYDDDHNIVGSYYPKERNRSGAFRDFHLLQEIYYNTLQGDRFGLNAWLIDSNRELPMLTVDYGDANEFENRQREKTFRSVMSWERNRSRWHTVVRGGFIHTWMAYDYRRATSPGNWVVMTHSRSNVSTAYGQFNADFSPSRHFFFNGELSAHQQFVRSRDKNVVAQNGNDAIVGYDKARVELSGMLSAKWQPTDLVGLSVVARREFYGDRWAPFIPALFADVVMLKEWDLTWRASVSRNHKFPSLNDLYFMPGGNPDLKSENGFSYDTGLSFDHTHNSLFRVKGGLTWFDSFIDNWILWLPTTKGFFSPRNMKKVHAYGVEARAALAVEPVKGLLLDINSSFSWTPSVNRGDKMSEADMSVGRQLPYVPRMSANIAGRVEWRDWAFIYKWCHYSKRFTMSSNENTYSGHLPAYFMSNISLERKLGLKHCEVRLKGAVNNLFNEDYLSVLSHPMPGINFEFFIVITPRF